MAVTRRDGPAGAAPGAPTAAGGHPTISAFTIRIALTRANVVVGPTKRKPRRFSAAARPATLVSGSEPPRARRLGINERAEHPDQLAQMEGLSHASALRADASAWRAWPALAMAASIFCGSDDPGIRHQSRDILVAKCGNALGAKARASPRNAGRLASTVRQVRPD